MRLRLRLGAAAFFVLSGLAVAADDASGAGVPYSVLLAIAMGFVNLLFGFVLSHAFGEIKGLRTELRSAYEALRASDSQLASEIANLRPLMITKEDFARHADREEREMTALRSEQRTAMERLEAKLETLIGKE